MELSVQIGNLTLRNPVGVASGTFGYGSEYESLIPVDQLGAIYTKAVTLEPRQGNQVPRMVETPSGMLNSIGLANVGIEAFISRKLPFLRTCKAAVIVNAAGSAEGDYLEVVRQLEDHEVDGYEINISCPNVKHGGLAFGTDPKMVESLVGALRKLTERPLIIKLTPNVTSIGEIAKAAEAAGADALSCINTVKGMIIDTKKRKPAIPAGIAGLSGPAVLPIGLANVYQTAKAVSIPVVGLGGITTADHAVQYLLAGASAVQIGTANFVDPKVSMAVLDGIQEYAKTQGFEKIQDFHGFF
ncbi:MAG: dihydroorotate dehydrogenase [Spirochaetia bacterium]